MKRYSLLIVVVGLIAFLQSCQTKINGTWKNDHIEANLRAAIDQQNKKLFKVLMANDVVGFKELLSPKLIDSLGSRADSVLKMISVINAPSYAVLDEFYTRSSAPNSTVTLSTDRKDKYDYQLGYVAMTDHTYASVLVTVNMPVNYAILAIYGKYDNAWKLNVIQVGRYSIVNKSAPDYYGDALKQSKKGNIINAANLIYTASNLAHPAGAYIKYKTDGQMQALFQKTIADANVAYHFPVTLDAVKGKPQVFAVIPQFIPDATHPGIYPLVRYQSNVPITDTVALKAENNLVQKSITTAFKGLDDEQYFIAYQVFNQLPTAQAQAPYHGFLQKVK